MEVEFDKKDILVFCLVLSIAFFLLGLFTSDVFNGRAIKVSNEKLVPIYRVDTEQKKVAITLDGMWGAKRTPELLQIFRDNDVNITFFFGGNWLEEYPNYVREIAANGHEVGNHSYSHPHMASLNESGMKEELNRTGELIKRLTGQEPKVFRPPFGEYNNLLIKTCDELGYYTIQWSIDSHDWMDVSADTIVKRVMDNVGPGDIVLMHNNGKNTPEALRRLIPKLKGMGYEIVPVSELIYHDNYYIETHTGTQKRKRGVQ
ncbi:polysaccharide deacetylase family protein [Halonatronum saccharophilum]|uniref:polysaccharide deacetylase family protein n=1 Tax=Halonatronum saccharophilum TaxID=150060 RepID=UPI00047FBC85|nr:polysaccharide deacetylase family protein [Halonatronum saccharophilum]